MPTHRFDRGDSVATKTHSTRRVLIRSALLAGCFCPALLLLSSCEQKSAPLRQYIQDELARLKDADPKADLDAALAKGDFRFIAIQGVGPLLPGVDDYDIETIEKRYGLRYIENATDKPADDQEKQLEIVAWGYGEQYNRLLKKIVHLER